MTPRSRSLSVAATLLFAITTPPRAQAQSPATQGSTPPPVIGPSPGGPAPTPTEAQAPAPPTLLPAEVPAAPEPAPQAPSAEPAKTEAPPAALVLPGPPSDAFRARLDYSDGAFYLRALDDNLVFVPGARMHVDVYSFAGPGVSEYQRSNGTGLKTNLFFRRFVLEFGGLVRKKWFYWIGGNFAPTQVDANETPFSTANVYDGFIGYMPVPNVRIYFGQYNAPFTLENVTSSRWLDFMERALSVRTLGTPYNKADGLMVWGDTESKSFEYQAGIFGGDGMNRPNIDNSFDVMGRVVVRPLASASQDAINRLQIGASVRYGYREHQFVRYDTPNLSTPGGYNFWAATYGSGEGETHIQPYRGQFALAGELYIPFDRVDVRGEFVYIDEGRREVAASDRTTTLRAGAIKGFGTYAQLSWWIAGAPRISGNPGGFYGVLKVPEGVGKQADYALQLVLRGELLRLHYDSDSRRGDAGGLANNTDDVSVNAYQACINYWATKHIRLSAEYSLYHFPGAPKLENQAIAPGVRSNASPDASVLHEFSFRVGLAL